MKMKKDQINCNLSDDTHGVDNFSNKKDFEQICLIDETQMKKEEEPVLDKKKNETVQLKIEETTVEDKEKLEEAEETVKKQSSKKKKWLNLIFLLINIGVVAGVLTYQLLNENAVTPISDLASKLNWGIIVLLIFIFALMMFLETAKFWILTYQTTRKSRPGLSYKLGALGKYYDNITPFATGEQPFQIYYLNKHGVSGADSVSIPMGKYVIWQLSFVTFTFIIMIFSISLNNFNNAGTAVVTAGSWIGFAINSALVLLVGILSISKKLGTKLITGILILLHKIKLIKNYDKVYQKLINLVDDYQSTMRRYAKNKWSFISVIFTTYLGFILHYSLPFVIHAAFYGFDFSIFGTILTYCVMIDLTASFLPLPGGTGAAELSFTALFGLYFVDGNIFWAMIIWRIFTYYSYILQGLIIIVYDYLIGNKRFQWEKKKWALEAESRSFEENHLKEFELSLQKSKSKNKKENKL
jgi:uncharacterized protein (TIRG00374 family)